MHCKKFFILTASPRPPRRGHPGQRRKLPLLAGRDGVASCVKASRGAGCTLGSPARANAHMSYRLFQVNHMVMFSSSSKTFYIQWTGSGTEFGRSANDQQGQPCLRPESIRRCAGFVPRGKGPTLKLSDMILIKHINRRRKRLVWLRKVKRTMMIF